MKMGKKPLNIIKVVHYNNRPAFYKEEDNREMENGKL